MEKRMIVAIALSMGLLVLWPYIFSPPKKLDNNNIKDTKPSNENLSSNNSAQVLNKVNEATSNEANKENTSESKNNKINKNINLGNIKNNNDIKEKTYVLENKYQKLEFSSIGARLKDVQIYNTDVQSAKPINFFSSKEKLPLGIDFLKNINFLDVNTKKDAITFTYEDLSITYSLSKEHPYLINVSINSSLKETNYLLTINMIQDPELEDNTYGLPKEPHKRTREFVYLDNGKTSREEFKDFEGMRFTDKVNWFAVSDKYYTTAVLGDGEQLKASLDKDNANFDFKFRINSDKFRFYLGPKDVDYLRPIDTSLGNIIDFGWLSFISVPILELMKFIYSIIPNYGLAIILLTFIVRMILYPLQHKSMKSMKRLQVLQPQIKSIQAKYKDDKQRMNKEVMQFMKTHKVNPMGGCFPMLLQLPVFFALYKVLGNSVELYQAPFMLWIQDLAIKDPYYILPALMGIMMFLQQKLTPNPSMDPTQAKMMQYMMPIIFTIFMINLPSGLTLYIMFSSLLGIVQQYFTNKSV